MINRREFIDSSVTFATSSFLFPTDILLTTSVLGKIDIHFFSLPKLRNILQRCKEDNIFKLKQP